MGSCLTTSSSRATRTRPARLPYLVRIPLGRARDRPEARGPGPHEQGLLPSRRRLARRPRRRRAGPGPLCVRRGAAIDLVLDRAGRTARSSCSHACGREVIFWQSARTAKQARPAGVACRPHGRPPRGQRARDRRRRPRALRLAFGQQQATTRGERLAAGDYAVELDGRSRRRRRAQEPRRPRLDADNGKLRYPLADLAACPARPSSWRSAARRCSNSTGPPGRRRRRSRRAPGPVPERADRVRGDPRAGPGVDLPLPRCGVARGGRRGSGRVPPGRSCARRAGAGSRAQHRRRAGVGSGRRSAGQ